MVQTQRPARLIALEGLDGTGKTTLARSLANAVDGFVLTTPPVAWRTIRAVLDASVRDSVRARALLYASTVQLASDQAVAMLSAGRSVVLDRYFLSTIVYHVDVDLSGVAPFLRPADLTVLLDLGIDERAARIARRTGNTEDDERTLDPSTDVLLRRRYLEHLQHRLVGRALVLPSSRDIDELVNLVIEEAWS